MNQSATIDAPAVVEAAQVEEKVSFQEYIARGFLAEVDRVEIATEEDLAAAGELMRRMKKSLKVVQAEEKEGLDPVNRLKAWIKDKYRVPIDTLEKGIRILERQKILPFHQEQERLRREAERKALEEAEKKENRLLKQAERAEEKGNIAKAEALRDDAQAAAVPDVPKAIEKPKGMVIPERWRAVVTDKRAALRAVLDGRIPLDAVDFRAVELNKLARAMKEALNVPGIKAVKELGVTTRG